MDTYVLADLCYSKVPSEESGSKNEYLIALLDDSTSIFKSDIFIYELVRILEDFDKGLSLEELRKSTFIKLNKDPEDQSLWPDFEEIINFLLSKKIIYKTDKK